MLRRRIFKSGIDYSAAVLLDILCSDLSYIPEANFSGSGKTAIGVVFYNSNGTLKVMAISELPQKAYGGAGTDLSITNYTDSVIARTTDFNGKENTTTMVAAIGADDAFAAGACRLFSPQGTKAGDWDLPSAGECHIIFSNKVAINASLTTASGTILSIGYNSVYLSSSEYNNAYCWGYWPYQSDASPRDKSTILNVRPIMTINY